MHSKTIFHRHKSNFKESTKIQKQQHAQKPFNLTSVVHNVHVHLKFSSA